MLEQINEPIEVMVRFGQTEVTPMLFRWRGRRYSVSQVNLIHTKRDGEGKIYYFHVSDNANAYKLSFATRTLGWQIDELYTDG